MTFSFDTSLAADKDTVRFEIGDTDSNGYFLHDETITALLASEGSVGKTIVASIAGIIALLSQPNFRADWLQVDNKTAREGYETLLKIKERKYGTSAGAITASVTRTWRTDSHQTEEPTYSWATDDDEDDLL